MKYVSLDIETTGLDPFLDQIIEIGAIVEDTLNPRPREECPTYHAYVDIDRVTGNLFAVSMNAGIFKKILELKAKKDEVYLVKRYNLMKGLVAFLKLHGIEKATFAGKNFGAFDLQFLKHLEDFSTLKMNHRFVDPTLFYTDFANDVVPPDLSTCKKRAQLNDTNVSHEALDDAWDVIQLLRPKYDYFQGVS